MWLYGVTVCKEPSGQSVWEEAEEIQYVAGYLERGHLAWLTDNSPTVRESGAHANTTLPWEPGKWVGNKKSDGEKKKKKS